MRRILMAVVALAASGCTLGDDLIGTGPIRLSHEVQACFANYKRSNPGDFAVSVDGLSCGYTYCPYATCGGQGPSSAIHACERGSHGVPCKIYARGSTVVWKSDEGAPGTRNAPASTRPSTEGHQMVRVVTFKWQDVDGPLIGRLLQSQTGKEGKMSIRRDRSTDCEGGYRFTDGLRGSWSLDCTDGNTVTGTFHMEGNTSKGTGTDAQGRPVTFTIR